jgi:hypothetical protein
MAGVDRAERALQDIIDNFKYCRTAKLTIVTERGRLKVFREENFTDERREVPGAASKGLESRRSGPSWQRRREQRAADPAVRRRAAAHAAAEAKAATEKAAAEKVAAGKAAKKAVGRGEGKWQGEEELGEEELGEEELGEDASKPVAGSPSLATAEMAGVARARQGSEAAAADTAAAPHGEAASAPEEQRRALRPRDQLLSIDRLRDAAGEDELTVSPVKEGSRVMCGNCGAPMAPDHQCSDETLFEDTGEGLEKEACTKKPCNMPGAWCGIMCALGREICDDCNKFLDLAVPRVVQKHFCNCGLE